VFEFVEVSLNEIALAVDRVIHGTLELAVALGWNMRLCAARPDLFDQRHRVIASVGDDMSGAREAVDQCRSRTFVAGLAGADRQPDRQSGLVHNGVDFRTQPTTRATDGVILTPFFPPAACWCARMIELSMKAMDSGDRAAKALKILIHTPALAQRLKRL